MTDGLAGGGDGQTPVHADDLQGLRHRWVRTQGQLDELERANVIEGRRWALARRTALRVALTDEYLRLLHVQSFGRVWNWAGQYRLRGTSIGVDPSAIAPQLHDAFEDARLWFAESGDDTCMAAAARLHHRIVAIHPFANGNGRAARLHTDVVARATGIIHPTWGAGRSDAREAYLAALRAADGFDEQPLLDFIWS